MKNVKQNVIVMGPRGYKKDYGGWETFIQNLISNWKDKSVRFHIFEATHDCAMKGKIKKYDDVICPQVYTGSTGSAKMIIFCAKALFYAIRYVKKCKLQNVVFYVLGVRVGPLFLLLRPLLKRIDIKIAVNPDGLEWKRAKWSRPVQTYLKLSELTMLRSSDVVVCDSKAIVDYIIQRYPKLKAPTRFIPYGAYIQEKADQDDMRVNALFASVGIKPNNYYLIVARFEPENNFELMIREFMMSNTQKDLVVVSNVKQNRFYNELKECTRFDQDHRIKFIGSVYDRSMLKTIRGQAYAYLHGHSVGGTNPSLLESMAATDINILYDVCFNREVGADTTLYFGDTKGCLARTIDKVEQITHEQKNIFGENARARVKSNYTWELVVRRHQELLNEMSDRPKELKKKIIITTILSKNNYGSVLQAYALNRVLSKMGYDPIVVDYMPKESNRKFQKLYRLVFKWRLRVRRAKLRQFMQQHIPLTKVRYLSYKQLSKNPPKADVYMVGSDQVWTDEIFKGGVNDAFLLKFANNSKKIAYASGTGKPYVNEQSLKKIAGNLESFNHVSVREQSLKLQLNKSGIDNVKVVLDPVFLLNRGEYRKLAKKFDVPYKYLLIYSFKQNEVIRNLAKKIAQLKELKIIEIGGAFPRCDSDVFIDNLGIEHFISLVSNADFIMTSSYHGTALSIIFRKQFLSVLPKQRSDRIAHLINIMGLQERMLSDQSVFNVDDAFKPIDYKKVNILLKKAIESSLEYLETSLE